MKRFRVWLDGEERPERYNVVAESATSAAEQYVYMTLTSPTRYRISVQIEEEGYGRCHTYVNISLKVVCEASGWNPCDAMTDADYVGGVPMLTIPEDVR